MILTQTAACNFKNLVVSGCSFSTVTNNQVGSSWPQYLQTRLGIENLYPLARFGAGNRQISTSLVWFLENHQLDPRDTLIVVMFSGNDRSDEIVDVSCLDNPDNWLAHYHYTPNVVGAISGGNAVEGLGNTKYEYAFKKTINAMKTNESRAVENYLHIVNLYNYLQNNLYQTTVFTKFVDTTCPNRSLDFDIRSYLPDTLADRLNSIMDTELGNLYAWCLKHNLLGWDDFHPAPDGHLSWVDHVLVPHLVTKLNLKKIKPS
jgi:hypothetical protein